MTVKQLLDHFNFIPDRIVYFDDPKKFNDVIYVSHKGEYRPELFYKFMESYEARSVRSWDYHVDHALYIMIGD